MLKVNPEETSIPKVAVIHFIYVLWLSFSNGTMISKLDIYVFCFPTCRKMLEVLKMLKKRVGIMVRCLDLFKI